MVDDEADELTACPPGGGNECDDSSDGRIPSLVDDDGTGYSDDGVGGHPCEDTVEVAEDECKGGGGGRPGDRVDDELCSNDGSIVPEPPSTAEESNTTLVRGGE